MEAKNCCSVKLQSAIGAAFVYAALNNSPFCLLKIRSRRIILETLKITQYICPGFFNRKKKRLSVRGDFRKGNLRNKPSQLDSGNTDERNADNLVALR